MKNIEIFEHTADVGIRLSRSTREELFQDAALAMFHIIAPENAFRSRIKYSVTVDGADDEELMVNWLSDLNYYFQTEQYVPVEIKLDMIQDKLNADIKGDIVNRNKHNIETEIKAVTYHNLQVIETKEGTW